ncbi:zinc finger CCCH domain-containing protein 3 [Orycteropus afer afer]|uniref:Zinc finger CCCH domain-containing protein 3 n=1 Tax=Orycteropus afer afer TaxID=1230840 RepID=A0A8B7B2C1_ORYAF|nr:zinc finger CCCH domain-containing protein 3 [Orycteropus afer afer]
MEEKEQLRRQIRLLQGLIDDYKTLHGNAPAPCTSAASRWQPPAYHSSRSFGTRHPRSGRRGFTPHQGPAWRKKYSLVNQPPEPADPPGDQPSQPALGAGASLGPDPQPYVLERQVQLSPDQNMVIKIKPPPSQPGSASAFGAQPSEAHEGAHWGDQRAQEGKGEPLGRELQPLTPGRVRERCGGEDPLLVCQKEPGKPRVVRSVSNVSGSPPGPQRTVSEGAVVVKARGPAGLPQRSSGTLGRKVGLHSTASRASQLLGDRKADAGRSDQPAPLGLAAGPTRATTGPRQVREASLLVSFRTNKFRKNNYKWVAASAKSPRAARRALSPRTAVESAGKAPGMVGKQQVQVDPGGKARKGAGPPKPGASPSKYKWKASSPSASSSSSHWQPEVGPRDHPTPLSPVLSQSLPEDRPATGPSGSKLLFAETPLSGYKVKSRTKIIRRRGSASLPVDKKAGPPATTAKNHFSLRRRQALRGKGSPVLKKTPNKGLLQVTRHRLCHLPPGRTQLLSQEVSSLHSLRTPPSGRVIKTRYRIIKKGLASSLSSSPFHLALPTWRARRLSLPRPLVLNRQCPAPTGAEKAPPRTPRWRNKGYRCIGGTLYRVSATKLSKTSSRASDAGSRPPLRTGRLDPASSCSRSLASRAVQRSLAIIRQARQKRKGKRDEYCMYYTRFGRCNRGEHCPYIHDPEKVAVCTRFLRGTCKKTDGTCPFSHHVSKDKMPVCSYFLKGICSNSSCPYSHVYVSRKAEVCKDFLKGYCPLGAKCKRKHSLLCPDFSRRGVCPLGARCQLLHRSQKRPGRRAPLAPTPSDACPRSRGPAGHGPRKSPATHRPTRPTPGCPRSTVTTPDPPSSSRAGLGSPSASPSASRSPSPSASPDPEAASVQETASAEMGSRLPSFISLCTSRSPARRPSAPVHGSPCIKDSGVARAAGPQLPAATPPVRLWASVVGYRVGWSAVGLWQQSWLDQALSQHLTAASWPREAAAHQAAPVRPGTSHRLSVIPDGRQFHTHCWEGAH